MAWKAIGPDGDKVGINLEGAPDSVWKKLTDINDNPLGASAQTKTLQIVPGTLDPLEVMLAGDTTDPVQVGELRIATYNQVEQNTVVVVSVNGAKAPTGLENSLNQIYGQAVASWQVHTDDITGVDYDWGFSGNGALDINTVLGNYTREMNNVISAYVEKKKSDLDKDKFYIFVMKKAEESGVAGRMPMANRVGFVFSDAGGNDGRVIAHELGHGAFNLRHPFGSDGVGTAKGSTDNLMDYSTGTHLWKHQWDNIHEPIDISLWESLVGSSDEESNMEDDKMTVLQFMQSFEGCPECPSCQDYCKEKCLECVEFEEEFSVGTYFNERVRDLTEYLTGVKIAAITLAEPYIYEEKYEVFEVGQCMICEVNENVEKGLLRYVIPYEDVLIIIDGKDLDGEEASRLLAAGFLVLEIVTLPVGGKAISFALKSGVKAGAKAMKYSKKVIPIIKTQSKKTKKIVKFDEYFKDTGKESIRLFNLNPSAKLMSDKILEFGGAVTEDFVIQFAVYLVAESINRNGRSVDDLIIAALKQVSTKEAYVMALAEVNYKNQKFKNAIECSTQFISSLQDGLGLIGSSINCVVPVVSNIIFRSNKAKRIIKRALNNAKMNHSLDNKNVEQLTELINSIIKQTVQIKNE